MKHRPITDQFVDRPNAPNDPLGTFEGTCLGQKCRYIITSLPDHSSECGDALNAMLSRMDMAIHVSGRDPFGHFTGPGYIREIANYEIRFYSPLNSPSGFGCDGPEPAVLLTWDGVHHEPAQYRHYAFWNRAASVVSIRGIYNRWIKEGRPSLTPLEVCLWMDEKAQSDALAENRYPRSWCYAGDKVHERAVRRLLEEATKKKPLFRDGSYGNVYLERQGRWAYRFR